MIDPFIAYDGFTYEGEAIREWLNGGHDTSPMTNMKLSRKELIPNLALRSAVHEWLEQHGKGHWFILFLYHYTLGIDSKFCCKYDLHQRKKWLENCAWITQLLM